MNSITLNKKPITPSKIVCIGRNYVDHIKELNNETPTQPVIFIKPNSAISDNLKYNATQAVHYEAELSFLVKAGKLHAVGFGLDLTKREVQSQLKSKGLPWERAKSFDGAAVFSDFVSFEGDGERLRLELFINGECKQSGGYDLMMLKPQQVMAEIQSFMTLVDGDVVMTGTPKGVGVVHQGDEFIGKVFNQTELLIEKKWTVT